MALRQGSKRVNPDELTQVSDSGAQAPLTPPQCQERRGSGFTHEEPDNTPPSMVMACPVK
ncbi:hypothetical protein CU276_17020 [Yersinia kristensenii]|nr:hypothetical protein CU276_17020 [Yersinia kristensenii]